MRRLLFALGLIIAAIIALLCALLLFPVIVVLFPIAHHYGKKISTGMPIGIWVSYERICSLGVPKFFAVMNLANFQIIGVMSSRLRPDLDEIAVKEMRGKGRGVGYRPFTDLRQGVDDPQEFYFTHPGNYEYMLHRRPRSGGNATVGPNRFQRRRALKLSRA